MSVIPLFYFLHSIDIFNSIACFVTTLLIADISASRLIFIHIHSKNLLPIDAVLTSPDSSILAIICTFITYIYRYDQDTTGTKV